MSTGKTIVLNTDAATIAVSVLTVLVIVGGATWNLRGFIASEIDEATAATNERLKAASADIRHEIRAGRESTERQMAKIRQFMSDLHGDREDNDEEAPD